MLLVAAQGSSTHHQLAVVDPVQQHLLAARLLARPPCSARQGCLWHPERQHLPLVLPLQAWAWLSGPAEEGPQQLGQLQRPAPCGRRQ